MAKFLKNTDPRFHLVEVQSRWTIRTLIFLMLAILALTTWHQEWLRPSRHIDFAAPSSEGLAPGISIRLSGFRIGKVRSITLTAPGHVRVEGIVYEKYAGYLDAETTAILRSENLISDRFIELSPGGDAHENPLNWKQPLSLASEPGIGAIVDAFREELSPVIEEIAGITRYLNDPEGDLKSSIANIHSLTTTLNEETTPVLANANTAIARIDEIIATFQNPEGSLQRSLASIEVLTATLDTRITPLINEFETTATTATHTFTEFDVAATAATEMFENLDAAIKHIQSILDEAGPEIPVIVRKSRDTIDKADDVVGSVRSMWPLRNAIAEDGEKTLRTSHDRP